MSVCGIPPKQTAQDNVCMKCVLESLLLSLPTREDISVQGHNSLMEAIEGGGERELGLGAFRNNNNSEAEMALSV